MLASSLHATTSVVVPRCYNKVFFSSLENERAVFIYVCCYYAYSIPVVSTIVIENDDWSYSPALSGRNTNAESAAKAVFRENGLLILTLSFQESAGEHRKGRKGSEQSTPGLIAKPPPAKRVCFWLAVCFQYWGVESFHHYIFKLRRTVDAERTEDKLQQEPSSPKHDDVR